MKKTYSLFLVVLVLLSSSGYGQYVANTYASGLPVLSNPDRRQRLDLGRSNW